MILARNMILCGVVIAGAVSARAEIDPAALADATRKVLAFERPLVERFLAPSDTTDSRSAAHIQQSMRSFFADLDDRAMRVAAIDLLDRRYVYLVNRELAAELLGPLVRDADRSVRTRAADAVGYNGVGSKFADSLIAMIEDDAPIDTLTSVAYAMGRSAHRPFVPHLVSLLRHASAEVRTSALFELTRLAPEEAFEHNVRHLQDADASVRAAAVQHLGRAARPHAVAAIVPLLVDEVDSVRERAVGALGQLQAFVTADDIAARLTDDVDRVRARAAVILGDFRSVEHVDPVAALLDDPSVVVRRAVSKALGAMGDRRVIERLQSRLDDADDQVRTNAAESIRALRASGDS